jgi:hypothetical protein
LLTSSERAALRSKNTNVDIMVSDGTVYFSPGGGFMASGIATSDFLRLQIIQRNLNELEQIVVNEENQIKGAIPIADESLDLRVDFSDLDDWLLIETSTGTLINFKE